MATIRNDHELKLALERLDATLQRVVGARFVESVIGLCDDAGVRRAVETALRPDAAAKDLEEAFRTAKAYSVKTYTDCGKDTDWMAQAAHFVGAAAAASLTPEDQRRGDANPAWKAAMQARMARNCEMIERQEGSEHDEAAQQYRIASDI